MTACSNMCGHARRTSCAMGSVRGFYHRLGVAEFADWLPYRLEGEALKRLAETDRGAERNAQAGF